MAKNAITSYSTTAASNTDVGGVDIQGTAPASNMDDAVRELMSHLAETNAGTAPWADTMTIGDAADLTKEFRFEASGITAGATRVLTVPDSDGTLMTSGASPTLATIEALTLGAGDMLYATAADTVTDLAIGTAGQFLVTNAGATAPEWASRPTLVSLEGLTLGAGDILYATAADTLADLAIGTARQALLVNAGATAPAWTTIPFTRSFESAQQTLTQAGSLTLAHSLGTTPKLYMAVLQCTTGELGYSIADEVAVNPGVSDSARGISMVPDATNINVRFADSPTMFIVVRKDTGAVTTITAANWRLVVRAWA
jgi:hypothetical protein